MSLRKVGKSALQSGCNDFEKEFLLKHFYYDKGILYWQTTGTVAGSKKGKGGYWDRIPKSWAEIFSLLL